MQHFTSCRAGSTGKEECSRPGGSASGEAGDAGKMLRRSLATLQRDSQSACFLRKAGMSYLSTPLCCSASTVEARFLRITAGTASSWL